MLNYTFYYLGHSTESVMPLTAYLSTCRSPWEPMSFAPMAESSRLDRGIDNISFWPGFRLTFLWNDPVV